MSFSTNGTLREQLFIHTEAGAGNTQCADGPGDQICRWEFPKVNDYTSHGCIKMSPKDIQRMGALIPHSQVVVCEKGSHMSMYDDQQSYFAALLPFFRAHRRVA